jgi:hypothetical protein
VGDRVEALEVKLSRVKVKPFLAKRGKKVVPVVGYVSEREGGSGGSVNTHTPGQAKGTGGFTPKKIARAGQLRDELKTVDADNQRRSTPSTASKPKDQIDSLQKSIGTKGVSREGVLGEGALTVKSDSGKGVVKISFKSGNFWVESANNPEAPFHYQGKWSPEEFDKAKARFLKLKKGTIGSKVFGFSGGRHG